MTARRVREAILALSTAGSRFARPGNLGYGTACAAIEQMTQRLAVELGPSGVRVVCLRPSRESRDAAANGSYTGEVFAPLAAATGVSVEQMLAQWGEDQTLLGQLPNAGPGGRCGRFPGVGPRRRHHRRGDRPDLRQRRAGAAVRTGADRRARLAPHALCTRRWKSSIGLPAGSSSRICRPPGPVTMHSERQPGGSQPFDFAGEVLDDQVDPVPAAGLWCAAVGHRPSTDSQAAGRNGSGPG